MCGDYPCPNTINGYVYVEDNKINDPSEACHVDNRTAAIYPPRQNVLLGEPYEIHAGSDLYSFVPSQQSLLQFEHAASSHTIALPLHHGATQSILIPSTAHAYGSSIIDDHSHTLPPDWSQSSSCTSSEGIKDPLSHRYYSISGNAESYNQGDANYMCPNRSHFDRNTSMYPSSQLPAPLPLNVLRIHSVNAQPTCTEPECYGKTFSRLQDLMRHKRSRHGGPAVLIRCPAPNCGRLTRGRKDKLMEHVRNIHKSPGEQQNWEIWRQKIYEAESMVVLENEHSSAVAVSAEHSSYDSVDTRNIGEPEHYEGYDSKSW